uniref:Uncharacterized protein n=1 Tax=Rhizophora mucronata TaxID=61149 RepID=A0A2P2NN42_RHIMU
MGHMDFQPIFCNHILASQIWSLNQQHDRVSFHIVLKVYSDGEKMAPMIACL